MKKIKLLVLLSSFFIVYLIYNCTNNNNLDYVAIGDNLAVGENSYGAISYGYSDYVCDYLKGQKLLKNYNKVYASKNKTIKDLYNEILVNESSNNYNIRQQLRDADILTLSIGLNDLIYFSNVSNNLESEEIVNNIFINYQDLIMEIKKYYKNKIYIVGYYYNYPEYNSLIKKLNKKYFDYAKKSKDVFVDISYMSEKREYFDNPNSYYPNIQGYKKIANSIINSINNKKKLAKKEKIWYINNAYYYYDLLKVMAEGEI